MSEYVLEPHIETRTKGSFDNEDDHAYKIKEVMALGETAWLPRNLDAQAAQDYFLNGEPKGMIFEEDGLFTACLEPLDANGYPAASGEFETLDQAKRFVEAEARREE